MRDSTRCDFGSHPHLHRLAALAAAAAAALLPGAAAAHGPHHGHGPGCGDDEAIGLALEVENGAGVPLRVKAGQRFWVDQLDVRAALGAPVDEGVAGLDDAGDFAELDWNGVGLADEEPIPLPNPDGTFTRRRFYRSASWMERRSHFTVRQLDAGGRPTSRPIVLQAGSDDRRRGSDDFFVRRFRAIQWTYDCPSLHGCEGATLFEEEALVELRHARDGKRIVDLEPDTAALEIRWSLKDDPWLVPVEQVASPDYDYGFSIDVAALTPPSADGTYAPGTDVTFQLTLRDGSGTALHPAGSLPTYNEAVFGPNPAGIQYYRAFGFIDPTATYYRRKHRERMLMSQIIGPAQDIQPIRTIAELGQFLVPGEQVVGTPSRDGVFAEFRLFPQSSDLFGGAFDPVHAGWDAAVPDTWTYHLPPDAQPGTYLVTVKGRRTYLGEDVAFTRTVEIQVGQAARTVATLPTGPCTSCHAQGGELSTVLHRNDNRAACSGCHVPLGFELEGPIFVRTHFVHSRSDRFDAPLSRCSSCHLSGESIQRTSQAACLSCHRSYPDSHVAAFGPVESMYVGGGRDSFQQCTGACHTTHPDSGL